MRRIWEKFSANGPVLVLAAAVGFSVMVLGVRAAKPLPAPQVTFLRFALAALLMWGFHRAGILQVKFHNRRLLALRGIIAGGAVTCFFFAIQHIHIGVATLLNNTFPFFALVVAVTFGQERFNRHSVLALCLAAGGLYFIFAPRVGAFGLELGSALGLLSGMLAGCAFVVIRELRRTDEAPAIYAAMSLGGMAVSFPLALVEWRAPAGRELGWVVVIALASTAAQLLMNHALRYLSASAGAVTAMATTVFAALWGIVIFGEVYPGSFWIGAALIFCAASYIALQGRRNSAVAADIQSGNG